MLGQSRSGNPLLRGRRMVLVDDEAETLEGKTECRDPDRVRKHAQHESDIDGAGSDGLNLRRHFHPLDVHSHVRRSGTRDLDGFLTSSDVAAETNVTQPEIADFATRGFAGETLGLFEALDGGQGSLLKLLAGKRQLDPLLRSANEKRDAEMRFEPSICWLSVGGEMFKRSAARAKCSCDATAAK